MMIIKRSICRSFKWSHI